MATGGRGISRTIVVEVITARLLLAKFHEEVSTFSCNRCAWIEHCSTGASEVKAPPLDYEGPDKQRRCPSKVSILADANKKPCIPMGPLELVL